MESHDRFEKTIRQSDLFWGYFSVPKRSLGMFPDPAHFEFDLRVGTKVIKRARLDLVKSRIWTGRRAWEEFRDGDRIECRRVRHNLFEVRLVERKPLKILGVQVEP